MKRSRILAAAALALTLALAPRALPAETETPAATPKPARGYVYVQTASQSGWLPLPETEAESYTYPIIQLTDEGGIIRNHLRLTPEGVYMEFATCENQDCVEQGAVTLGNKDTRPLMNMIICLPQQVFAALYTPEEIEALYAGTP